MTSLLDLERDGEEQLFWHGLPKRYTKEEVYSIADYYFARQTELLKLAGYDSLENETYKFMLSFTSINQDLKPFVMRRMQQLIGELRQEAK